VAEKPNFYCLGIRAIAIVLLMPTHQMRLFVMAILLGVFSCKSEEVVKQQSAKEEPMFVKTQQDPVLKQREVHVVNPPIKEQTKKEAVELPDGFGAKDRFSNMDQACMTWARELAPKQYVKAVVDWCDHRTYNSSRGNVIHSRVDGSWIHDRDRPLAYMWYRQGMALSRINPDTCEHHKVDYDLVRPKSSRKLAKNWPFSAPKLSPKRVSQWLHQPYDAERFGTRGPHDHNYKMAQKYAPGCYPTETLDRYDFSAYLTVKKSVLICEKYERCFSKWDIKKHWRNG